MRSDTVKEIATALSNFQCKMTAVKKDSTNPFYKSKYASLDTIWETIRKPLAENGLSVAQTMDVDNDKSVLETTLYHTSGEWISGVQLINPVKPDPQSQGSAITYARRYSLSAILGLVSDDDDDANTATKPAQTAPIKPGSPTAEASPLVAEAKKLGAVEMSTKTQHALIKGSITTAAEWRAIKEATKEHQGLDIKAPKIKDLTLPEAEAIIEEIKVRKGGE